MNICFLEKSQNLMNSLTYQQRIRQKLGQAFASADLEIIDDSARHKGHAGHDLRGETHFRIRIVSPAFTGLSRLERHRLIYGALAEEIKERVHALTIEAFAPNENTRIG
jgi:BolA protein